VEQVIAKIPNGAMLMIWGFIGVGGPVRLIDELCDKTKRTSP
jgi:acyl CoA:acetate/3-ketoacid CoA transferase alpha subunit